MTLPRMIVLLLGGLAVGLVIVVLRAETTRLDHEVCACERQAAELALQRETLETEVVALCNPTRIRARAEEILTELRGQAAPEEE
jgi:cell division protein FtsL